MTRQNNKSQLNNLKDNERIIGLDSNNNVKVVEGHYKGLKVTIDGEERKFIKKEGKPNHGQAFEVFPSGTAMHKEQKRLKKFFREMKKEQIERKDKGMNAVMFKRIFIGLERPEDKTLGIKAETIDPSLKFMKLRFPELDVESIAASLGVDLVGSGKEFNFTFGKLKLIDKCKREYNKKVTELKRLSKGIASGDIKEDIFDPEEDEMAEISGNEPLTASEALMVMGLMEGKSQREIYAQHKVHPSKQVKLRKSIERKMEVL